MPKVFASVVKMCASSASAFLPDVPLGGYESGDELDLVERLGFHRIGRLRVWLRA